MYGQIVSQGILKFKKLGVKNIVHMFMNFRSSHNLSVHMYCMRVKNVEGAVGIVDYVEEHQI